MAYHSTTHVKYPLEIVEITKKVLYLKIMNLAWKRKLSHGIECFGYRIVEKDIQGALLVDKLLEMGGKRLKDGEVIKIRK